MLALLVCAGLVHTPPAYAADGAGTDYIIKYKDSAVPFEVVSEAEMRRLQNAGRLEWYEPDGEMTLLDGEISPYYADDKWDLAQIHAEPAFRTGALGKGVRVGVLDSGVNPLSCLADNLLPGHNYLEGEDADDTADKYGHGTLVAALIAGQDESGYLGAAPGAELVPLKITDGKGLMVSTVCRAIYGGVDDYGCKVLNLSFGIREDSRALREAIGHAAEQGVVMVSAVGNNGTGSRMYPAEYESVLGVGAVDRDGNVYYHSNHNDSVFLTAPGANVKTAGKSGGYAAASGTSFSVPYVTAAAAVLLGLNPSLTAGEIASILAESAKDAGSEGWDESYGWGILDLGQSVARLGGTQSPDTSDTPCRFLSASTLANTTDADVDCTYLLAEYDADGICRSVSRTQLTIPPHGRKRIDPPKSEYYGQFVYETTTKKPLADARKATHPS